MRNEYETFSGRDRYHDDTFSEPWPCWWRLKFTGRASALKVIAIAWADTPRGALLKAMGGDAYLSKALPECGWSAVAIRPLSDQELPKQSGYARAYINEYVNRCGNPIPHCSYGNPIPHCSSKRT